MFIESSEILRSQSTKKECILEHIAPFLGQFITNVIPSCLLERENRSTKEHPGGALNKGHQRQNDIEYNSLALVDLFSKMRDAITKFYASFSLEVFNSYMF
jgi:hypothetical protein